MIPLLKASNFNTWFDTIPPKWEVRRIKTLFLLLNGSTPSNSVPEYWDGDIIWVTPADLGRLEGNTIRSSQRRITKAGYQSCGTTLAPRGSLVLTTRAPVGNVAILGNDACTNQGCKTLVPRHSLNSKYFYYQLLIARPLIEALAQGSTFVELSNTSLSAVPLLTPPLEVQNAIASFLDHKTAQIDALIAEKRKLIELLREKRNALISHAVTKGLNPDVPMKDSGVEWIGEIPAHWKTIRNRYLFKEINERSETGDETLLSVHQRLGVVKRSDIASQPAGANDLIGYKICRVNDLILNKLKAYLGVFFRSPLSGLVSPDYTVFRAVVDLVPEYYEYLYHHGAYIAEFTKRSKGVAIGLFRLYSSDFYDIWSLFPPPAEQRAIVEYVRTKTSHISTLMERLEESISILSEYRSTLISSAVIGKIDVRGWQEAGINEVDKRGQLEQEVV